VVDRLRVLLDRPLDPAAARAVLVLATAILLGFAALLVIGTSEAGRHPATSEQAAAGGTRPALPAVVAVEPTDGSRRRSKPRRQDPQDEKGSAAARRATKALRLHRALQHVPYRRVGLSIQLVGARGGRAVLAVSAPTISAARRGWRRFLRRYGDSGRAYLSRFEATGGHRG
jgi:hypothetical protein